MANDFYLAAHRNLTLTIAVHKMLARRGGHRRRLASATVTG